MRAGRSRRSRRSTRSSAPRYGGSCRPSCARTPGVGGREVVPQRRVHSAGRARLHRTEVPREYGGDEDPVADAVFVEELARCGSGGLAAGIGAHAGIALPPIWKFGTEEQKQRYLVPGIRGEKIAALAITEPDAGLRRGLDPHRRRARSTAATWSTARRRSSPAACAPTSSSPRSRPSPRAATVGCRS